MSAGTIRVLYVGDDAQAVADALASTDDCLDVIPSTAPDTALDRCRSGAFDAVVVADDLPGSDAIEFVALLQECRPDLPTVFFSDAADDRVASRAIAAGVTEYVPRRDGVEYLAERVRDAVDRARDRSAMAVSNMGVLEAAPIGVAIFDAGVPDDPIVAVNDRFEAMTGYDEEDAIGRNWLFLAGAETDQAALEELQRAVAETEPATVELRQYRRDETPFWNRVTLSPIDGDDSTYVVGFYEDITERHRRAGEREAAVDLLRGIYDVTTDPDLSFETKIDRLLTLGCEALGLPYGFLSNIESGADGDNTDGRQHIVQACGDHALLQPGESCPLSEAYCRRTIETDGLLAIQDAIAAGWEDDPAFDVFELGSYVGGKVVVDGELYGTLCFAATDARDRPFSEGERTLVRLMSKWASYELERRQAHDRLQRQNERLEEFASIVSHDLRNPLNVAMARLDLLAEACDSEHVETIAQAHDRMAVLIEDLLTVAREGETATDPEPVVLSCAVEDCWETVATEGATLHIESDRTIRADPGQLQQLLENLARNAVEHAGTDVSVTVGDLDDGFYVADDGPGIPQAEREAVLESGHTTADDGTGYGLGIVEGIADAHGWDIAVTASETGGARFEFTGVEIV